MQKLTRSKNKLLQVHLSCKRPWEKKQISVTPKWHLMFYHLFPTLAKYRRICHSAEDPIERTHAEDKQLERNFAHIRNHVDRKFDKLKVRQVKWNHDVQRRIEEVNCSKKWSLKATTILYKKLKQNTIRKLSSITCINMHLKQLFIHIVLDQCFWLTSGQAPMVLQYSYYLLN